MDPPSFRPPARTFWPGTLLVQEEEGTFRPNFIDRSDVFRPIAVDCSKTFSPILFDHSSGVFFNHSLESARLDLDGSYTNRDDMWHGLCHLYWFGSRPYPYFTRTLSMALVQHIEFYQYDVGQTFLLRIAAHIGGTLDNAA
jgi:hypothetical protein